MKPKFLLKKKITRNYTLIKKATTAAQKHAPPIINKKTHTHTKLPFYICIYMNTLTAALQKNKIEAVITLQSQICKCKGKLSVLKLHKPPLSVLKLQ